MSPTLELQDPSILSNCLGRLQRMDDTSLVSLIQVILPGLDLIVKRVKSPTQIGIIPVSVRRAIH